MKPSSPRLWSRPALALVLLALFTGTPPGDLLLQSAELPDNKQLVDQKLATAILADPLHKAVLTRGRALLKTGFNAGSGYREVWIRDFATFIELSCDTVDPADIRESLLLFFQLQGDDGNIIDGYVPREQANIGYRYIKKPTVPDYWGHKNTVETDQESSLLQALAIYVRKTGDTAILDEEIDGKTVRDRLQWALDYLLHHRFAPEYGLLWGATTADWGDVQPEHEWGVELDANSHLAIDIYDNAMFLLAIEAFLSLPGITPESADRWQAVQRSVRSKVREHLWDKERGKFIPHIYLAGSPFPPDLNELEIHYHGGTAVAILADLLSEDETRQVLAQMRENVRAARADSIGLTVYPPYPAGLFKNPSMGPYSYQNGGDWDWFGGRMIQALIRQGLVAEAYAELRPMLERVEEHNGFYEWWNRTGEPQGSATFRGGAGVLGKAILMLQAWAQEHAPTQ